MTKSFFQFKEEYLPEEEKKEEDDHANEKSGRVKDLVNKKYREAVERAEKKSADGHTYGVYQDRTLRPEIFEVRRCSDECTDLDRWVLLGQAKDKTFSKAPGVSLLYDLGEGTIQERLSISGRRSLKRAAKKNKARLKIARARAKRKRANTKTIQKRAQKRARKQIAKHLTGGRSTSRFSHTQLNRLQTMVNARSGQLDQLRRKLIPQARKDDRK